MLKVLLGIIVSTLFVFSASAQTAGEIVAKYILKIGGMEKIQAIKSLRQTGKLTLGGGFEAVVVMENKRPKMLRSDFTLQGMTAVSAYDGRTGWKIEPFQGKKDPEALSEDEMKGMIDDADFDDALINFQARGNKVEYVGTDTVEGSDVFKLKVTLPSGTIKTYYMDADYYVPIKIETKRTIRGAEVESETILGDYKEVGGVYFPHSLENGAKGSPNKSTVTIEKIEVNVPVDDSRFMKPSTKTPAQPGGKVEEDLNVPKTPGKKGVPDKSKLPTAGKKPIL